MSLLRRILGASRVSGGKITPAGPPTFILESGYKIYGNRRNIVRDSSGNIYISGLGRLFKSVDNGVSFTQVASWSIYGSHSVIAIDGSDVIHIAYGVSLTEIGYRTFNTATGVLSAHETAFSGETVSYPEIGLDSNGIPHVAYQSVRRIKGTDYTRIFYTNRIGGSWIAEESVSPNEVGVIYYQSSSLGLDGSDNVHVVFVDYGNNDLWYAVRTGVNVWTTEEVDTDIKAGEKESLIVDSGGNPCIAYIKGDNDLWFAKRNGAWVTGEIVGGTFESPALASNGGTYYYVLCRNTITGQIVLYEKENAVWSSEITIVGAVEYVACKWSYYWNNQAGTYVDFIYWISFTDQDIWYDRYTI